MMNQTPFNFCIHYIGLSLINCMQTEYMQKWTKTVVSKDKSTTKSVYKKCMTSLHNI